MIKKVLHKMIKATSKWLENNGDSASKPKNLPRNKFSYDWLNRELFPGILADGGGALRPNYTWGVMHGAHLAKVLNIKRISVIEFGVAGGRGLLSLEKIACKMETIFGVEVEVYGFDTGTGLPEPKDHRDLPNMYSKGRFVMEVEKLKARLTKARLVLGLVEHTIEDFIRSEPAPVAFIAIDLDYYSSTMDALRIIDAGPALLLPRVHCYFDDILGRTCCEFNGERLAIADFNKAHEMRKIDFIHGLRYHLPPPHANFSWSEKFYMAHLFDHDLYGYYDGLARDHDIRIAES